jgi:prevent-host-death family protein
MGSARHRPLAVGCRELKTRLATYMRQVKDGTTIIVTEHGRPVAELRPIAARDDLELRLSELASQGLVSREVRGTAPLEEFTPIESALPVSQALIEDRQDRC